MTAPSLPPLPTGPDRVALIVLCVCLVVLLIAVWWTGRHEHKSGELG